MKSSGLFAYPDVVDEEKDEFLGSLDDDELATVLGYMQRLRYPSGKYVIHAGDVSRDLYIATAGRFERLVPGRRGERRASWILPGDIFGELAFFDGLPRSLSIRAVEDSEALVATVAGFERLRLAKPQLAVRFLLDLGRLLSGRIRDQERQLIAQKF